MIARACESGNQFSMKDEFHYKDKYDRANHLRNTVSIFNWSSILYNEFHMMGKTYICLVQNTLYWFYKESFAHVWIYFNRCYENRALKIERNLNEREDQIELEIEEEIESQKVVIYRSSKMKSPR